MTSVSHQADADTTWPHGPLTLVLFDLDGTLSDSARGITASMRHALGVHDVAVPEQHVLDSFVGPPFKVALEGIGIPAERVPGIVGTYREDYNAGRLFDNDLYPGMADRSPSCTLPASASPSRRRNRSRRRAASSPTSASSHT